MFICYVWNYGTSAKHNINVLYEAFELTMVWYDCLKNKGMILDCPLKRDDFKYNILEPVLWNQSHSFYEDSLHIPLTTSNTRRKNFDLLEYFGPTHSMSHWPKIS